MRLFLSSLLITLALLPGLPPAAATPQHALTVYGEPAKYPAGFSHFDYTNARAPKGGTMRRSAVEIGHFDHVLPYIDKGIGVTQIDGLIYSPLAQRSLDEPYTVYGLVAQKATKTAPCPWISPPCRYSPNTGGKPVISLAAVAMSRRWAAAPTR